MAKKASRKIAEQAQQEEPPIAPTEFSIPGAEINLKSGRFELRIGSVHVWCDDPADAAMVAYHFYKQLHYSDDSNENSLMKPIPYKSMSRAARYVMDTLNLQTMGDLAALSTGDLMIYGRARQEVVFEIQALMKKFGLPPLSNL